MKRFAAVLLVGLLMAPGSATADTKIYGWEDGTGTILGFFSNVSDPTNVTAAGADVVHTGLRGLRVTESPEAGTTPQAYVAFITGLTDGDVVDASFWAYDTTPGDNPSIRIWGHYATSADIEDYQGSAGGNSTYPDGAGWDQLSHSWTFDSNLGARDALVVEVRLYSLTGTTPDFYVDDLSVTAPVTATINHPGDFNPPPVALGRITLMQMGNTNVNINPCATGGEGTLTYYVDTLPSNGSLSDGAGALVAPRAVSGQLKYTPTGGWSGLDSFDFHADDTQPVSSNTATHELGVQNSTVDKVVITEAMHSPSGDDRVFEYVEIYNYGSTTVTLATLDVTNNDGFNRETTGNLGSATIDPGEMKIIAVDATTLGIEWEYSLEAFTCEWSIFEADIIRIELPVYETLFANANTGDCTQAGSRILLFDTSGDLLDAVDFGRPGTGLSICEGNSAAFLPFDWDNDSTVLDWYCASQMPRGIRTGATSGDTGTPGHVELAGGGQDTYVYDAACFGACDLTNGDCVEGTRPDECDALTCGQAATRWNQGATCGASNPDPFGACCLPTGTCVETDDCTCSVLMQSNFIGEGTACVDQNCPIEVAVVINELNYDAPGTDTESLTEFIELYGTPGASLAGWTLEFFNGNGPNDGDLYQTIDLATAPGGAMPGDGYLVVGDSLTPELDLVKGGPFQNGSPRGDGVVLLFGSIAIEALSYETGTNGFTAFDGQAAGTFLDDILFEDADSTTLQKLPDGGAWAETNNNTPGASNFDAGDVGACCRLSDESCTVTIPEDCDSVGFLVYQGDGTDCDANPCIPTGACCLPDGACIDGLWETTCVNVLEGIWRGEDSECTDIDAFVACLDASGPGTVSAGGCESWDYDADTDVDLNDFWTFQQNACPTDPIGACCLPSGECQEITQWECDRSYGPLAYRGNSVLCAGLDPACEEPTVGDVLINEVWADDPGGDDNEFIELFGTPSANLSLFSLIIVDGDTAGDTSSSNYRAVKLQADLSGQSLDGNGYFVMGTGPQAGPPVADVNLDLVFGDNDGFADDIQNLSQTYALVFTSDIAYCTSNGVPDATCTGATDQLTNASATAITANAVDMVATRYGSFDHVYFFAPLVQDSGFYPFDYAQRIPNGTDTNSPADWETIFGNEMGDAGDPSSPGAANVSQSTIAGACCIDTACELLLDSVCASSNGFFNGYGTTCTPDPCNCTDIAGAPVMVFPNQEPVCITGAIISSTTDAVSSGDFKSFFIQDPVGTNGLMVWGANADIDPLLAAADEGNAIEIRATLQAYFDEQELIAPFEIVVLGDPGIPTPFPKSVDEMNDPISIGVNDGIISTLVVIKNAVFVNANGTAIFFTGNVPIRDADDPGITHEIRLSGAQTISGNIIPQGPQDIVGVITTYQGNFNLKPRTMADITPHVP